MPPKKTRGKLNPEDRERANKGIRARQKAIKTLIENHRGEFNELLMRQRVAAGLSPVSTGPSRDKLEERIRKNEEKLAKDRELLRLVS